MCYGYCVVFSAVCKDTLTQRLVLGFEFRTFRTQSTNYPHRPKICLQCLCTFVMRDKTAFYNLLFLSWTCKLNFCVKFPSATLTCLHKTAAVALNTHSSGLQFNSASFPADWRTPLGFVMKQNEITLRRQMMIDFFHLTFKIEILSNGLWNIKAAPCKKWMVGLKDRIRPWHVSMVDYKMMLLKEKKTIYSSHICLTSGL